MQWCTETLPEETYFATDGVNDMFWPRTVTPDAITARCRDKFGFTPRTTWIADAYGDFGPDFSSRIVFSQGHYE